MTMGTWGAVVIPAFTKHTDERWNAARLGVVSIMHQRLVPVQPEFLLIILEEDSVDLLPLLCSKVGCPLAAHLWPGKQVICAFTCM